MSDYALFCFLPPPLTPFLSLLLLSLKSGGCQLSALLDIGAGRERASVPFFSKGGLGKETGEVLEKDLPFFFFCFLFRHYNGLLLFIFFWNLRGGLEFFFFSSTYFDFWSYFYLSNFLFSLSLSLNSVLLHRDTCWLPFRVFFSNPF